MDSNLVKQFDQLRKVFRIDNFEDQSKIAALSMFVSSAVTTNDRGHFGNKTMVDNQVAFKITNDNQMCLRVLEIIKKDPGYESHAQKM